MPAADGLALIASIADDLPAGVWVARADDGAFVYANRAFEEIMGMGKSSFSRVNGFQHNIAQGKPNEWRCRSGSRYLYICEDGLVHWCSQQRGYPGIPLEKYTAEDRRREYFTKKFCAPRCTVSCVQQIATVDNWRGVQTLKPVAAPPAPSETLVHLTGAGSPPQG